MGIFGFPSEEELTGLMGYVTEEDREKWARMRAASDGRLEEARNGLTAQGLASKSASPALNLATKKIEADMHATSMEQRRATMRKATRRTVTTLETEEPVKSDGPEFGF